MKLQNLFGQIGVIHTVIFKFFGAIIGGIYNSLMSNIIINKVFEIGKNDLESNNGEDQMIQLNSLQKEGKLEIDFKDFALTFNQLVPIIYEDLSIIERFEKKKSVDEMISISINELIVSKCFPCFRNKNIKQKERILKSINHICMEYTDVITFVNTTTELEKLKYILFSEEQLALYNLISSPEIPIKDNFKKKVSKLYKYSKNIKDQRNEIIKFNEKLKSNVIELSSLDKKLMELID